MPRTVFVTSARLPRSHISCCRTKASPSSKTCFLSSIRELLFPLLDHSPPPAPFVEGLLFVLREGAFFPAPLPFRIFSTLCLARFSAPLAPRLLKEWVLFLFPARTVKRLAQVLDSSRRLLLRLFFVSRRWVKQVTCLMHLLLCAVQVFRLQTHCCLPYLCSFLRSRVGALNRISPPPVGLQASTLL